MPAEPLRHAIDEPITLDELSGPEAPSVLARLRADEPASWVPAIDGWLVTGREAVIDIMRDADAFTVDHPGFTTGQLLGPSMLSTDGTEQRRHRQPFVAPFGRRRTQNELVEVISKIIGQVVVERVAAPLAAGAAVDLRSQLAAPVATRAIIAALELDVDPDHLLGGYRCIVAGVDALSKGLAAPEDSLAAVADLRAAFGRTPSQVVGAIAAGSELTGDEVFANAAVALFGAIETVEGAIGNLLWHLLTNPGAWSAAASDEVVMANALDESLRLEPAAAVIDRYATVAATTAESGGNWPMMPDQLVRLSLTSANRCPAVYTDPDDFVIDRDDAATHVTFVVGPHACIGAHLARLEMRLVLQALFASIEEPTLVPDQVGPVGLIFRKPDTVRVIAGTTAQASR